jgi:hypothetical protein
MNNPLEFVIVIVVITFVYKLISLLIMRKDARRSTEQASEEALAMQRRLNEVEERVQVLERIVTDERYDLKRQFRDLGG